LHSALGPWQYAPIVLHAPSRLAQIRGERDLTQAQLSKLSGVKLGTISGIESGRIKRPQARTLGRLARALKCTIADFFEDAA
jgi:transcriptional regulator with XRE-family HTH domain